MICKMFSRHKRAVIAVLLLSSCLFGAVQILQHQEGYSPLQMLYSTDGEAQRLLKFLLSYHYQCNNTLNSSVALMWPVCVDQDIGLSYDPGVPKLAYSVGPLPDLSFETLLSQNLSVRQLVFLPKSAPITSQRLQQLNVSVFRTTVVPNDPADFGRNSLNMNTINSIMSKLGHRRVDILKLEHVEDLSHSHEILYFMVKDGILTRFRQLHIVIEIDKVDEGYLYNWYKTLYTLFHLAGFRLYHTSASSPLCLQVTMMESCRYFLSWVSDPGPQTVVMYPPAIDGSEESEVQRLKDFLDMPERSPEDVISVVLSSSIALRLSRHILMTGSDSCHILIFQLKVNAAVVKEVSVLHLKCSVTVMTPVTGTYGTHILSAFSVRNSEMMRTRMTLSEGISRVVPAGERTNIVYVDLGSQSWSLLSLLLNSGALQNVNQLILVAPVYPTGQTGGHQVVKELRQHYSELKRVGAFGFTLSEVSTQVPSSKISKGKGELWQMSFVKS